MNIVNRLIALWTLALFLALGACAMGSEPFEYTSDNELKPGPGILTGEDGVFTIYGEPKSMGHNPEENQKEGREEGPHETVSP